MSLRAIPLMVFAFLLYNLVVFSMGAEDASGTLCAAGSFCPAVALQKPIFSIGLLSGGKWTFAWGDFIMLVTLVLLFAEIVKATFSSTSTLIDHALSMLVFIALLVEFLVVPQAATSIFFLILIAALIDVIAGYTIGIRVARRDLNIGADR